MDYFPLIPGYKIERKLGQGKFADVYLAVQEDLDRKTAIKILSPLFFEDKAFRDSFLKEAQKISRFTHPNIANILEAGESGGHYYIVTEYFPENLRDKISRCYALDISPLLEIGDDLPEPNAIDTETDSSLDHFTIIDIVKHIAWALDYAHKEGVIHMDLTPETIRFRSDGTPAVDGFFLSKLIIPHVEALKKKGLTFFSPHYVSPEQALRKPLEPASDIYSLGVVFYEMLTGSVPYNADEPIAIENQHIIEPIPQLPDNQASFQPLLDRMMEKNKDNRFSSALELIRAIDDLSYELPENRRQQHRALEVPSEQPASTQKAIKQKKPTAPPKLKTPSPERSQWFSKLPSLTPLPVKRILPIVGVVVLIAVILLFFNPFSRNSSNDQPSILIKPTRPRPATAKSKARTTKPAQIPVRTPAEISKEKPAPTPSPAIAPPSPAVRAITLRSQYKDLTTNDVKAMLSRYGFFDKYYNKDGKFKNNFELITVKKEKAVIDRTTGLMWHQAGSEQSLNWARAKKWLAELNQQGYVGYSNWRFPTLEELESLMEGAESSDGLFIDPLFFSDQRYIWTGDTFERKKLWVIDFFSGDVNKVDPGNNVYVRPVRSL
ncbi:MAG: protein kinase domain-containing protein [Candidatus Omnitrophota bacterium]